MTDLPDLIARLDRAAAEISRLTAVMSARAQDIVTLGDQVNRLTRERDEARDEYRYGNFGALAKLHIGIDLGRAGWAIIPDTEDGIANFLLGREITAAAVIQRIAPALGLRVCEAEPSVEAV